MTPHTTLDLASSLRLPAAEAIAQKYAFVGRSGSGKSYAAMRLAELMLDVGAQVVALDWVGIWWSLRLARDGRGPGFPHVYIFGGESADVPLEPTAGKLLADLVVDRRISAVFDLMHFRKADRTRFATAFAEQLFYRKKTSRSPIHLFLEEAQAYLPQFVKGEDARMDRLSPARLTTHHPTWSTRCASTPSASRKPSSCACSSTNRTSRFTRQALADHANRSATSSAYDVDLRQLSRFNVITYPEKGMVALHPRMRQWCQP